MNGTGHAPRAGWVLWLGVLALSAGLAFAAPERIVPDSDFYALAAEGRYDDLIQPFSKRVLAPLAAGTLHRFGLPLDTAFWLLTAAALAALLASAHALGRRYGVPPHPAWPAALLAVPALVAMARTVQMPDLPHAALVALLFALLVHERAVPPGVSPASALPADRNRSAHAWAWAFAAALALLTATAQATRESTLLFVGLGSALALVRRRWAVAAALVAGLLLGNALAAPFAAQGQGNAHGLSGGLYLLLKVPFNALFNVGGLRLWTNTFGQLGGQCAPVATMPLPEALQFGDVRVVGRCAWQPVTVGWTFVTWTTAFGVLPGLLAGLVARRGLGKALRTDWPFPLALALVYGALGYLLGPTLGAAVDRLVGYGWPAFWIATPVFAVWARLPVRTLVPLAGVTLSLAWASYALPRPPGTPPVLLGLLLAAALAGQVWAFRIGRRAPFPFAP